MSSFWSSSPAGTVVLWSFRRFTLPTHFKLLTLCCCFSLQFSVIDLAANTEADPPVSGSWLGQAQQELAQREYFASENGNGLQAPNRAQGFRTYFDENGIALVARSADDQPLATIAVLSVGRAGSTETVGLAEVHSNAAQVTLEWFGVSARFENSAQGIAAEWTLAQRPGGSGPVLLDLDIADALPELGDAEVLLHGSSKTLRLGSTTAQDAAGRSLAVTLAIAGNQLQVAVDDTGANYPIKLMSLINGINDAFIESNQTSARLGSSVASAGDVNGDGFADVIVGAYLYDSGEADEGAAFIYFGGPGAFNTTADAQLESNQVSAQMGYSVSGAGDVNGDGYADVIVGAILYHNGQTNGGAAFLYFGGAGVFNNIADARLESDQVDARMGYSVAGAGDVNGDGYADVIVGAWLFDNGENNEGAAFIYFGGPGVFNTSADAQLESNQVSAQMGFSVSGASDVNGDGYADVVVGAPFYDNDQNDEGVALVYFGGAGTFNTTADAQLESNQVNTQMGYSVSGAGDVNGDGYADVIVGAPFYDTVQSDEGLAFVYFGGPGAFNTIADAQLEANQVNAQMGWRVAGAGDVNGDGYADVIVGANLYDNGQNDEGAAFVYFGGAGVFNNIADAQLESNQASAIFGWSVAGAGDVNGDGYADVIVGAYLYDNDQNNEGAAFVYFGGAGAFNTTANAQLESNQANADMGFSVAGAGDVNGDGYADVIVGARLYDNGQTDEGAAFLYFGGAGAINTIDYFQLEVNQANAEMGYSVAGAGDVNGDGYADVIVGARWYDNGQSNEGAAFLYFGGAGAFNTFDYFQLEVNQANAEMGYSVAGAGDVNGDGYADVIVGAHQYVNGEDNEGAAFLYFGGAGAFNTTSDALLESNQAEARMGSSVAGAGDVNGDGYADAIVGARLYDNGQTDEGAAFLYFGGAGVFNNIADAQLESNQASAIFGWSVAGAGDVNGDGHADVIVGAPLYDNGEFNEGAAFIYFGAAGAFNTSADALLESNKQAAHLGNSVAGAGDINGDGFADIIVGANEYSNGQGFEGAVFLYFGGVGAFNTIADAGIESNQVTALMGFSVAGAGDVNGDGFADVIVGAFKYDNGQTDEGSAFIYFGTANGRLVQASQYRPNATTPVAPWGLSQQTNSFVVKMQATSPRGRERARLQLEACPPAAPFGSLLCKNFTATSWTEIGANSQGVNLSLTATGLDATRVYHWRTRVQYAPLTVTQANIFAPPKPSFGPWRRLQANGDVADIRIGVSGPMIELIFEDGFE